MAIKSATIKSANGKWGHCRHCSFFDSPARAPLDGEQASCKEPTLVKFGLRVVGTCGCNHFRLRRGLSTSVEEPMLARAR